MQVDYERSGAINVTILREDYPAIRGVIEKTEKSGRPGVAHEYVLDRC